MKSYNFLLESRNDSVPGKKTEGINVNRMERRDFFNGMTVN